MRKITTLAVLVGSVVLLLLAGIAVVATGQTTAPPSTLDYSLIFRPPSDPNPVKATVPHFRWQNTRGKQVTVDSLGLPLINRGNPVAICLADSATLAARYGRTQQTWILTVTDTTRASADAGTIGVTILDMWSGATVDTSFFIDETGLMCPGLIIDSVGVGFAPYDSIDVGDRTVFSWITSTWQ